MTPRKKKLGRPREGRALLSALTTVELCPAEKAKLKREAKRQGISLSRLLRMKIRGTP